MKLKYAFISTGKAVVEKQTENGTVLKECLPKTDLPKTTGYVFVMVYLFLPNGTQIFTGSMDNIRNATKKLPTCHGVSVSYQHGNIICRTWDIYGRFSDRIHLLRHSYGEDMFKLIPKTKRSCWVLYFNEKQIGFSLIKSYRRLPSQYLRILKELETEYSKMLKK